MENKSLTKLIEFSKGFESDLSTIKMKAKTPEEFSQLLSEKINDFGSEINPILFSRNFNSEMFDVLHSCLFIIRRVSNKLPVDDNYQHNSLIVSSFYNFLMYNLFSTTTSDDHLLSSTAQTLSQLILGLPDIPEYEITSKNLDSFSSQNYIKAIDSQLGIYSIATWSIDFIDISTWSNWVNSAILLYYKLLKCFESINPEELIISGIIDATVYFRHYVQRYADISAFMIMIEHLMTLLRYENFPEVINLSIDQLMDLYQSNYLGIDKFQTKIGELVSDGIIQTEEVESNYMIKILRLMGQERRLWVQCNLIGERILLQNGTVTEEESAAIINEIEIFQQGMLNFADCEIKNILKSPFSQVYLRSINLKYSQLFLNYLLTNNIEALESWNNEIEEVLNHFLPESISNLFLIVIKTRIILAYHYQNPVNIDVNQVKEWLKRIQYGIRGKLDTFLLLMHTQVYFEMVGKNEFKEEITKLYDQLYSSANLNHLDSYFQQYVTNMMSETREADTQFELRTKYNPLDLNSYYFPRFNLKYQFIPFGLEIDKFINLKKFII